MSLNTIYLPERYNYIGCFLTLDCNLKCDYCINFYGGGNQAKRPVISGRKWIEGLNRLACPDNLPITFQGGEPSLQPDFIRILNNIKPELNIDVLTNLCFDVKEFIDNVNPLRLRRNAPYPSIRVSYHPPYMDLGKLIKKVLKLQRATFSVGIFSLLHPQFKQEVLEAQKQCADAGIDFRTKEFLGDFNGQKYGNYLYPEAVGSPEGRRCLCRTSEFLIGPDGSIFRCHHDLYKNFSPIGNLLDPDLKIKDVFRECNHFGNCNPCDLKIKTNRFQIYGHTSVEIKDIFDER